MKWFKHFSKARYDTKMIRLINKYGLEGYGLYFLIVESIAFQLETESPIPDLEETAHDIAEFTKSDTIKIQEIIEFCIEQKLFEYNHETGRIMCLKLLTHLDNTMSSNPEIKKIMANFNKLKENSSHLKQIRLDKIRLDNNTRDTKTKHIPPTTIQIKEYLLEKGVCKELSVKYSKKIHTYYSENDWHDTNGKKVKSWKQKIYINWLDTIQSEQKKYNDGYEIL